MLARRSCWGQAAACVAGVGLCARAVGRVAHDAVVVVCVTVTIDRGAARPPPPPPRLDSSRLVRTALRLPVLAAHVAPAQLSCGWTNPAPCGRLRSHAAAACRCCDA
eukprot:scaffold1123_cov347-Prasinococcus_capsulatus_cf.AAC.13